MERASRKREVGKKGETSRKRYVRDEDQVGIRGNEGSEKEMRMQTIEGGTLEIVEE